MRVADVILVATYSTLVQRFVKKSMALRTDYLPISCCFAAFK